VEAVPVRRRMPTIAEVAKEAVVGAWALPGDISIVGYDGIEPARHAGLTTVAGPLEESGAPDAARLLGALEGIPVAGRRLPVELVVRVATGPRGRQRERRARTRQVRRTERAGQPARRDGKRVRS